MLRKEGARLGWGVAFTREQGFPLIQDFPAENVKALHGMSLQNLAREGLREA